MPFGRLSPVSETDDESITTTETLDLRPRPLNFSRPRPSNVRPSSQSVPRSAPPASIRSSSSSSSGSIHVVSAFHKPSIDFPDEPDFDAPRIDSGAGASLSDDPSPTATDLVWDEELGGLQSRRRDVDFDAQRVVRPNGRQNRSDTSGSVSTVGSEEQPLVKKKTHIVSAQVKPWALPASPALRDGATASPKAPELPEKTPRIVKRISFDQQSEHMSVNTSTSATSTARGGQWEDSTSHHTVSINGDVGEGMEGVKRFNSSDYDISELSEKELAKLKKKGINPHLYMEMKAARKGKGKWVGPLVGNTYM